jgi:hypothetical protein
MLEWLGIEFWILKLHFCIAYKVDGVGVGGLHGYPLSYVFKGIGPNGRGTSFLGPSWESWCHHCRISP